MKAAATTADRSGDLHDERLWRALEHAPDLSAVPDWRSRQAILRLAHAAVGEPDPEDAEAELEKAARSWWNPLAGGAMDRRKPRRRWYGAGLAAALVAVLAVALWPRGPIPQPSASDAGQARGALSEAEDPAPTSSTFVGPPRDSTSIPLLPPSFFALREPAPDAAPQASAPPVVALPDPLKEPPPPRPLPRDPAALPPVARANPPPADAQAPRVPPPAASARSVKDPAAVAVPEAANPARAPMPPAPPGHPAVAPGASPPPAARTETAGDEPPTFDALMKWNRVTITRRGGESRTLPREEAGELSPLLGSAALSAGGPQPLKGTPEWRVTLERGAQVLAVFEISGSQVRWREGHAPAATGTPSAGAISALREALGHAVAQEPQPQVLRPGFPPPSAEAPRAP
ncbi:MAG: hypothetical protein J7549_12140 [Variovorax sp.]|nr:hypothetical protein [Variovorax sp.]